MWVPLVIGCLVVLLAVYSTAVEPRWLEATDVTVTVDDLPPSFEGFTILHLSDLHGRVEVFSWAPFVSWLKTTDMVAVTGDLYSLTLSRERLARALEGLRAPSGVYYVSGNHDYRQGELAVEPWIPGERRLDNQVVAIERGEDTLWVAGLPDLVKGRPDWIRLRKELEGKHGPVVFLAHRPDVWMLPGIERVALVLAGHTHGGQVVVPGFKAPLRHNKIPGDYVAGRLDAPGKPVLMTSRGLGTSELPIRFGARPEVIRIRLTAGVVGEPRSHGEGKRG